MVMRVAWSFSPFLVVASAGDSIHATKGGKTESLLPSSPSFLRGLATVASAPMSTVGVGTTTTSLPTDESDEEVMRWPYRRLSLAHPTTSHADTASSSKEDDASTGVSPTMTSSRHNGGGSIASRTASISSRAGGSSDTTTGSSSGSDPTPTRSALSTPPTAAAAPPPSSSNGASASVSSNNTEASLQQQQPTGSGEPQSSTGAGDGEAAGGNDGGKKKPYTGPLPTVFEWDNEAEDSPDSVKDGQQNTHGYFDASNRGPINPVVDDILQFLDDDQYKGGKYYGGRAGKLFPKEKEDPAMWPAVAGGIFVLAALVLCISTACKNYRKRKDYRPVPAAAAGDVVTVV
jgi:hypothetical protein